MNTEIANTKIANGFDPNVNYNDVYKKIGFALPGDGPTKVGSDQTPRSALNINNDDAQILVVNTPLTTRILECLSSKSLFKAAWATGAYLALTSGSFTPFLLLIMATMAVVELPEGKIPVKHIPTLLDDFQFEIREFFIVKYESFYYVPYIVKLHAEYRREDKKNGGVMKDYSLLHMKEDGTVVYANGVASGSPVAQAVIAQPEPLTFNPMEFLEAVWVTLAYTILTSGSVDPILFLPIAMGAILLISGGVIGSYSEEKA